jgi:LacI family repressor for deo operon, udp, cdd, tsx, nupC, and nupG
MTTTLKRGPLHERLRVQLKQQIAAGRWRPGARIPSERDLAATYGISMITVRRALHDLALEGTVVRRVPAGTFVTEAAVRPHQLAVAATGARSVDSPFFGPLIAGVQEAARSRAELRLLAAPEGTSTSAWLKQVAHAGAVEGMILITADALTYDDVAPLDLRGFPYVLLNRRIPGHAVWCTVLNDYEVGRQAVDYLHRLGHRRLAHIGGPPELVTAADRVRGFLDGLRAHGLLPGAADGDKANGANGANRATGGALPGRASAPPPGRSATLGVPPEAPVAFGRFSYGVDDRHESGRQAMRTLLERTPRPTAVFAASDDLAVGAYRALREASLDVPGDVSLIGMSNTAYAAAMDPPLTSFDDQRREMGRQALQLLLDQIEGRVGAGDAADPAHRTRRVAATLVERASCRVLSDQSS